MKNDKNKINISDKVMKEIFDRKIKIRPRWKFLAEEFGLESGLILILAASVFVSSLIVYYWKINELRQVANIGGKGVVYILYNFPYELIVLVILFLFLLSYLVKKMDWGYKRSWLLWLCVSLFFMVLGSSAVFAFNIHERLDENIQANNYPIVKPFYQGRMHNISDNAEVGQIGFVNNEQIGILEEQYLNTESVEAAEIKSIQNLSNPDKDKESIEQSSKQAYAVKDKTGTSTSALLNQEKNKKKVMSMSNIKVFKKSEIRINNKKLNIGDRVKIIGNRKGGVFQPMGLYLIEKDKDVKHKKANK